MRRVCATAARRLVDGPRDLYRTASRPWPGHRACERLPTVVPRTPEPLADTLQEGVETLTATEMLVAVSEMLRDVQLGPMELGLWFRRRPGENEPDAGGRNHSGDVARSKP